MIGKIRYPQGRLYACDERFRAVIKRLKEDVLKLDEEN